VILGAMRQQLWSNVSAARTVPRPPAETTLLHLVSAPTDFSASVHNTVNCRRTASRSCSKVASGAGCRACVWVCVCVQNQNEASHARSHVSRAPRHSVDVLFCSCVSVDVLCTETTLCNLCVDTLAAEDGHAIPCVCVYSRHDNHFYSIRTNKTICVFMCYLSQLRPPISFVPFSLRWFSALCGGAHLAALCYCRTALQVGATGGEQQMQCLGSHPSVTLNIKRLLQKI